ncbi:MAG: hypothetical protein GX295_09965 [Syntrophomonadaceae bacterium]|mgnify:CR=1 FL=1|nr:hypothetical protein [Syntrophomonadaceae bacterium]
MNKIKYLILAIILCLAITGNAFADEAKPLMEWGTSCVSSDPPGTLDYIDPGNPNGALDIGSMQCWTNQDNHLECKITNGYPGYQASVHTEIINISGAPVQISGIEVIGNPDCVLVGLTDTNGNNLINQIIDKNSSIEVKVVNRIKQNAAQAGEYRFEIKLLFNQDDTFSPPLLNSSLYNSGISSIYFKKFFLTGGFIFNTIQKFFSETVDKHHF